MQRLCQEGSVRGILHEHILAVGGAYDVDSIAGDGSILAL